MANLTVNTEKYEQITLNTKPHSDPLIRVATVGYQSTIRNHQTKDKRKAQIG